MYPPHSRRRKPGIKFMGVHPLYLIPSQVFEPNRPKGREKMDLCDALVGLEGTALHSVPNRVLVLHQELGHGHVRRREYWILALVGKCVGQLVRNLLACPSVDAKPLPLRPIAGLPAPIRSLAGPTTIPVSVLPRHERPPLRSWSGVGVRVGVKPRILCSSKPAANSSKGDKLALMV